MHKETKVKPSFSHGWTWNIMQKTSSYWFNISKNYMLSKCHIKWFKNYNSYTEGTSLVSMVYVYSNIFYRLHTLTVLILIKLFAKLDSKSKGTDRTITRIKWVQKSQIVIVPNSQNFCSIHNSMVTIQYTWFRSIARERLWILQMMDGTVTMHIVFCW